MFSVAVTNALGAALDGKVGEGGHGSLRRWSARHSTTHYRVHARVTGTRAYRVNRVTIAYDYLRTY